MLILRQDDFSVFVVLDGEILMPRPLGIGEVRDLVEYFQCSFIVQNPNEIIGMTIIAASKPERTMNVVYSQLQ